MELTVDNEKKKKLQRLLVNDKKGTRVLKKSALVIFLVGLFGFFSYLIYNILNPEVNLVNVNGITHKDAVWIIISSSFFIVPSSIIALALTTLASNLASRDNSSRIEESVIVSSDCFRYSYRIKHQSFPNERRVIIIKKDAIKKANYDSRLEKVILYGDFISEYYDDYKKSVPVDKATISDFVLYDYFRPALKSSLNTIGIRIE